MATYTLSAPDGNTYTITGPDGAAQSDVQAEVLRQHPTAGTPPAPPATQAPGQQAVSALQDNGSGLGTKALLETAAHLASGAVGGMGGGLNYLGTLAGTALAGHPDPDAAKAVQEATQQALTYQPRTSDGKALAGAADKALGTIPAAFNKAGEWTTDQTGSPLLGAAVNTAGNAALSFLPIKGAARAMSGATARDAEAAATAEQVGADTARMPPNSYQTPAQIKQASLDAGKAVGYQTTPNYDPNASGLDRAAQGIAGQANSENVARAANQPVTNALGAKAVGLPPAQAVTQTALQQIRQAAIEKGYDPIKDLPGDIPVDAQFLKANAAIKAAHGDELSGNPDVTATADLLNRQSFNPAKITDQIQTLRSRAQDAFAQSRGSAGTALKAQADELEALIDRHLSDMDNLDPAVLARFRAARQLIAKTYTVGENVNPSTGNIDAAHIGQALKDGAPLTDELKTIADFANAAPRVASVPNGAALPTSPLNTAAGVMAAHSTGGLSLGVIPAARAFAAKWLQRRNENPAMLQPASASYGQSALDAIHGSAAAFNHMYGSAAQAAPGALISTEGYQQ
jgi:hypothetical protein